MEFYLHLVDTLITLLRFYKFLSFDTMQLTLLHKPITTAYQIIYDGMITYNVYILRKVTFSKQAYSFEASNTSECLLNSFIMVPWYDKKLSSRFLCKTN